MSLSTHILTHQTRWLELWASVLFWCHRGCTVHLHHPMQPILSPMWSFSPSWLSMLTPETHIRQSAGLVKTSPWKGILAFLVSMAGPEGSYSPHGFRCMRLVLTFHAFHKGNISQMTDVLGHAHVTPHTARLVLLKHLFP